MELICSKCDTPLLPEDINISTDLGKCNNCYAILKLSELSREEAKTNVSSTPPIGSFIQVDSSSEGELTFTLPKVGITAEQIPMLIFGVLWVSFVAFWTFMAARGSLFFALFSIPFWFVGISMLYGIVIGSQETQKVTITSKSIKLEVIRPIFPSKFEANFKDIQEISISNMRRLANNPFKGFHFSTFAQNFSKKRTNSNVPTILSFANTKTFFEIAPRKDQVWITKLLNNVLKEMNT